MLLPALVFIPNGVFHFISIFIVVWLCSKLNVEPTLLMVIIPAVVMIWNDKERISRAKKGSSNIQYMLE